MRHSNALISLHNNFGLPALLFPVGVTGVAIHARECLAAPATYWHVATEIDCHRSLPLSRPASISIHYNTSTTIDALLLCRRPVDKLTINGGISVHFPVFMRLPRLTL